MRSSILFFFVLPALFAYSLAAPIILDDSSLVARDDVFPLGLKAREVGTFDARYYIDEQDSGVLDVGGEVSSPSDSTPRAPLDLEARDVEELVARDLENLVARWVVMDHNENGTPYRKKFITLLPDGYRDHGPAKSITTRELHELLLRAVGDDESGASKVGDKIKKFFSKVGNGLLKGLTAIFRARV